MGGISMTDKNNQISWDEIKKKHFTKRELLTSDLVVTIVGAIIVAKDKWGLTQDQIKDATGITQANISNILALNTNPSMESIALLLDLLGLKVQVVPKSEMPNIHAKDIHAKEQKINANFSDKQ
jgi:DNA-binding phage protein